MVAGMLTAAKPVYATTDEPMEFATFDDGHGLIETVLFPDIYRERGHVLFDQGPFILRGKVEEEFGAVTLRLPTWTAWSDGLSCQGETVEERCPKTISPSSAKLTFLVPIGVLKVARPLTANLWVPASSAWSREGVACFSSLSGNATVEIASVATGTVLSCLSRPMGTPSSRSDTSIRVLDNGKSFRLCTASATTTGEPATEVLLGSAM